MLAEAREFLFGAVYIYIYILQIMQTTVFGQRRIPSLMVSIYRRTYGWTIGVFMQGIVVDVYIVAAAIPFM